MQNLSMKMSYRENNYVLIYGFARRLILTQEWQIDKSFPSHPTLTSFVLPIPILGNYGRLEYFVYVFVFVFALLCTLLRTQLSLPTI